MLSMSAPDLSRRETEIVNEVLAGTCLSIGPMQERFEEAMASYIGSKHAVAVSSGTAGLHLCVIGAGVAEGDEVITTPFSFVASANCALYERARPVFVDIEPHTLNLDPQRVEDAITARTKAILPVHVFGQPCAMEDLMGIAQRRGLAVIEDACEAIGAEFKGRKLGTFGASAVFAFYPNKQMTTGEGGIITTDDTELAMLFRSLRNQGRGGDGSWLNHVRLGYNYRLDEMSCALGLAQLERIEELLAKRDRVAGWYTQRLRALTQVEPPAPSCVGRASWFVYVIKLAAGIDRDGVMAGLRERGVPSRTYFPAIHLQPFYRELFGYAEGMFPIAEDAARRTLALPFHGNLEEEDVDYVCSSLGKVLMDI